MPEDLGEKTEDATARRREEARRDGNIARSQDLAGALLLLAVTVVMWAAALPLLGQAREMVRHVLDSATLADPRPDDTMEYLAFLGDSAVRMALPILLIAWGIAYLANFAQVGWLITSKPIQPTLNKLNPISGFRRIFGLTGIVKGGLDAMKVTVIAIIVVGTIMQYAPIIVGLPYLTAIQSLARVAGLMLDLAFRILAVLLLLGVLDFMYQKWKHSQDLKMTKQEVRDELKQTDGDPETKRRRSRMQQHIAMQRISSAVPRADVVVTNPEHISVAIRYDHDEMHAPRVVAKGADFLALRIRQLAMRHGVPIVERKPLARALYRQVQVGQEIPPDFYKAVAEILAYVYRMDGRTAAVGA